MAAVWRAQKLRSKEGRVGILDFHRSDDYLLVSPTFGAVGLLNWASRSSALVPFVVNAALAALYYEHDAESPV